MRVTAHVALPLVVTTTNAAAPPIAEATTVNMSLIHALENVTKERLVFPTPTPSPTDGTVLPPTLHATCHMTTVAPPPVAPAAPVQLLMLAICVNAREALPVKTALMWTTVCLTIIPALPPTRPPVLTTQGARGPFVSVPLAGEGTAVIWTLMSALVTQIAVTEVIVLITQGATRVRTVHQTQRG